LAKIIDFDEKLGQFKKNLRDAPPVLKDGMKVFEKLTHDERELITGFIFGIIKTDIREGLSGEEASIFFDEIDTIYGEFEQRDHESVNKCFFCDEEADAGICLKHLMSGMGIKNMKDLDDFGKGKLYKKGPRKM